jgi:hypothetical protein
LVSVFGVSDLVSVLASVFVSVFEDEVVSELSEFDFDDPLLA